MSSHGIDVFNFEHWQGPPPTIPQQHVIGHNRAGANDVALQLMGTWGDPFEVTLTSHWASLAAASAGFYLMNQIVGTGYVAVKYAGLNYTGLYATGYHVQKVEQVNLYTATIVGQTLSGYNCGVLITRFVLVPQRI